MKVLFTTSKTLGSWLIRKVTGEPFSHCAIQIEYGEYDFVIHASTDGVEILPLEFFIQHNRIQEVVDLPNQEPLHANLHRYVKKSYDYFSLLWLGLAFLCRWPLKRNNWAVTKAFTCTELVTALLYGTENSVITPYGLFLKLRREKLKNER